MDASHVYVRALALGCFYSHISTRTFRRALTASLGQLRGDKECPFSGVTSCGRVWRKVLESDAQSVALLFTAFQKQVDLHNTWSVAAAQEVGGVKQLKTSLGKKSNTSCFGIVASQHLLSSLLIATFCVCVRACVRASVCVCVCVRVRVRVCSRHVRISYTQYPTRNPLSNSGHSMGPMQRKLFDCSLAKFLLLTVCMQSLPIIRSTPRPRSLRTENLA